MHIRTLYILILTSLFSFQVTHAQESATVKVSGEVTRPLQLSLTDLQKMKPATALLKDRDGKEHPYTGVAVSDI